MSIQNRKKDHVTFTISGQSEYHHSTGFEELILRHHALPELNYDDISTETALFGRIFSAPIFISSMTGGYSEAGEINKVIASICEKYNLPMGVGSQRIMLENPSNAKSFSVVRQTAPNAFIAANIGGAQLIGGLKKTSIDTIINSIEADAIIVHLNPLQEMIQPEGDRNFKGILDGIRQLAESITIPVIVKETGAGIGAKTAQLLYNNGIRCIDVAGSGGTSWAKVENYRQSDQGTLDVFNEWGIPTVTCLTEINTLNIKDLNLIASGGIRTSLDIIKSICLGASIAAIAQPVIKIIHEKGAKGLDEFISRWIREIRIGLLLTRSASVSELGPSKLIKSRLH